MNQSPHYPKRLIEVDLPIARISAHARREKSIRHGHISTLHIWWARRPLAACRAVICAALWPDPADDLCPPAFRAAAVAALNAFANRVNPERITEEKQQLQETVSEEARGRWEALAARTLTLDPDEKADWFVLRVALLDFIADFANWDNSTVPAYLETARALTQAAHEALGGEPRTRPLVVDPFAGGGSIPLEALRVGADAFASDLNPVSVLLNTVVLEQLPIYAGTEIRMNDSVGNPVTFANLATALRYWGEWVKAKAEAELDEFYAKDPDGSTPFAYIWARTINCEGPGCGAEIPLIGSMWLSRKKEPRVALCPVITPNKHISFRLIVDPKPSEVVGGFTRGNKATCPVCNYTTPTKRVSAQLQTKHGGSAGARLLAVVSSQRRGDGNKYRLPTDQELTVEKRAIQCLKAFAGTNTRAGQPVIPDEDCPPEGALGYRFQKYGITHWRHLYSPRQLLAVTTFSRIVDSFPDFAKRSDNTAPYSVIQTLLTLAIGRMIDRCCTLCRWEPDYLKIQAANGGQNKMPMMLDFVESNPFGGRSGDWIANVNWIAEFVEHTVASLSDKVSGQAQQSPAQSQILPNDSAAAMISDPPYYAAFGYSDLSEFFYVWLRRSIPLEASSLFARSKPPKSEEAIVIGKDLSDGRTLRDHVSYLKAMSECFEQSRNIVSPAGIATVVFASKDTSAWEAILESLVTTNWTVTASWPIDTEMAHRTRALNSAALNSSIHIVCRPRENADGTVIDSVGEWRDVLDKLPKRIHEWMPRLAADGVVGADAIFACLGPALEIFSRYSRVEKASGEPATLREYLEHVWAAVSTEALSLIFKDADAAGLEPDARLTAMWLWTLGGGSGTTNGNGKPNGSALQDAHEADESEATADDDSEAEDTAMKKGAKVSGFVLEFDAARKIAQGLGVHLEKSESVVEVAGDKARLLPVAERTRFLFGQDATNGPAPDKKKKVKQRTLFDELEEAEAAEAGWADLKGPPPGSTVLDRLHQTMILFAAGRGEMMKRFLVDEGVGQDARFWKLAQSLSALYPTGSDEKRWVDGVLARKKGLGQ